MAHLVQHMAVVERYILIVTYVTASNLMMNIKCTDIESH